MNRTIKLSEIPSLGTVREKDGKKQILIEIRKESEVFGSVEVTLTWQAGRTLADQERDAFASRVFHAPIPPLLFDERYELIDEKGKGEEEK